jgi:hypothetical protein
LIATPRDGVYYDGEQLIHQRQCPVEWQQLAQNVDDPHGELWLTYYSHIFNPARLNEKVMQGHLPVRFWKNLPEGELIPGLITQARTGKQQNGQASGIAARAGKRIALKQDEPEQVDQRVADAISRPKPAKVTPETFAASQDPFGLDSQPLAALASRA